MLQRTRAGAQVLFAVRDLWNIWRSMPGHSALMLAARTTLPHFSVSAATNFSNSARVIGIGSAPKSASRAFNFGSARAAIISLLSFWTISVGVFLGAPTPYHVLPS